MGKNNIKRNGRGRFAKGKKPGPGRPKKLKGTTRPYEDWIQAYEQLGGIHELVRWAAQNNSNRSQFYSLLLRTIPKESIERLLAPKERAEDVPNIKIEYVPEWYVERINQLEAFILNNGLKVPEQVERKFPIGGGGGTDSGDGG